MYVFVITLQEGASPTGEAVHIPQELSVEDVLKRFEGEKRLVWYTPLPIRLTPGQLELTAPF